MFLKREFRKRTADHLRLDALQAVSSSYYQYPTGLEKNPDDYAIRQANLRAYVTLSKVVAHAFDVLWVNV